MSIVNVFSVFSSEAFGSPTLVYNQTVSPTSIFDGAVGSPTLVYDQTISPVSISSSELFGFPRIVFVIGAAGITSAEAFGNSIITYDQSIIPIHIKSKEAFGQPTIGRGISVSSIASEETFGELLIANGKIARLDGIVSQENVPNGHVLVYNQTIFPNSIASEEKVAKYVNLKISGFCQHIEVYYPAYAVKNNKLIKRVNPAIVPGVTVCRQGISKQVVKI